MARVVRNFLRRAWTLPWPALSSDLSPIELMWDQLKRQMPPCHSVHDLEVAVQDLWTHLPQDNVRRLINSMPDRLALQILRTYFLLFLHASIFVSNISSCEYSPSVDTSLGKIIGKTIKVNGTTVNQFLGIPYAKPPTGERRFNKPSKVEHWSHPLRATTFSSACFQGSKKPYPWVDAAPGISEDCLYLNVWAPSDASPETKKAIFFWIHGGGYYAGSTRQEEYHSEVLSALGDIIVVTVNYRLSGFGFLSSGSNDAPGNVGLWDILTGLQWVNDHISVFGGDVSRITVGGESVGSMLVGMITVSPLFRGLYARSIMESGAPTHVVAEDNTQNIVRSQALAEAVNCANKTFHIEKFPKKVVTCLRGVDAVKLADATSDLMNNSAMLFMPQFGDDLLPKKPRQAVIDGEFQNNEILVGTVADEGSFLLTVQNPDIFGFFGEKNSQVNKSAGGALLRKMLSGFPATEKLIQYYLSDDIQDTDYYNIRHQLYTALGDFLLFCPTVYFAEKFAEKNNNVYYFIWAHRPSKTPWAPWMGQHHFGEVQFVFGLPVKHPERYESSEVALSVYTIKKWTNFVKYGNPGNRWPLFSKDDPKLLYLGSDKYILGKGPHKKNCDFLRQYYGF